MCRSVAVSRFIVVAALSGVVFFMACGGSDKAKTDKAASSPAAEAEAKPEAATSQSGDAGDKLIAEYGKFLDDYITTAKKAVSGGDAVAAAKAQEMATELGNWGLRFEQAQKDGVITEEKHAKKMDDFFKQKIVWNRIASEKLFAHVDKGIFIQDSMHFFTGNHLNFLCSILNSKLFVWLMNLIVGDAAGGNAGNSDNVKNLKVPIPSFEQEQKIENLLQKKEYEAIDNLVYELYNLSKEEIDFIEKL